jgi:hypothetical protein
MIDEEFLMCLKSEGSHHVPEVKARDAMLDAIAAKLATIDEVRAVPKSQEIEFINILAEERARPQREPACKASGSMNAHLRMSKTQKGATGNGWGGHGARA